MLNGEKTMTVSNYRMVASNGKAIRTATKVTFADGYVVRFTERMSKREAVKQATTVRNKGVN
jgi:hypothetical protein